MCSTFPPKASKEASRVIETMSVWLTSSNEPSRRKPGMAIMPLMKIRCEDAGTVTFTRLLLMRRFAKSYRRRSTGCGPLVVFSSSCMAPKASSDPSSNEPPRCRLPKTPAEVTLRLPEVSTVPMGSSVMAASKDKSTTLPLTRMRYVPVVVNMLTSVSDPSMMNTE